MWAALTVVLTVDQKAVQTAAPRVVLKVDQKAALTAGSWVAQRVDQKAVQLAAQRVDRWGMTSLAHSSVDQ